MIIPTKDGKKVTFELKYYRDLRNSCHSIPWWLKLTHFTELIRSLNYEDAYKVTEGLKVISKWVRRSRMLEQ